MAIDKFDYNSKDFYDAIRNLAERDFEDNEIAEHIGAEIREIKEKRNDEIMHKLQTTDLTPEDLPEIEDTSNIPDSINVSVFSRMKNGKYEGWTDEENRLRSLLISQVLEHARSKLVLVYKGVYDKLALGKWKTKNTTTTIMERVNRDGEKYEEKQTTEQIQELAPNLQALTLWRWHHDKEFRKEMTAMKNMDVSIEDKGIDKISINVSYNKKEDCDLQNGTEH